MKRIRITKNDCELENENVKIHAYKCSIIVDSHVTRLKIFSFSLFMSAATNVGTKDFEILLMHFLDVFAEN